MAERINPSEDPTLFSFNRARRGARLGAITGLGTATALMTLTSISFAVGNPEYVVNNPTEMLLRWGVIEVGLTLPLALAGALIDGFKPSSRIIERRINREINTLRDMKNGVIELWSFMRQPGFMDILLQEKEQIAKKLVLLGGLAAVSLFGFKVLGDIYKAGIENLLDEAVKHPSNIPVYLSEYSAEIAVAGGALLTYAGLKAFLRLKK